MSFTEKVIDEKGYRLELVVGKDASKAPFFAYILFHAKTFQAFEKASSDENPVEMEEYGIIIKRGYGKPTSEDEQAAMKLFKEEYLK